MSERLQTHAPNPASAFFVGLMGGSLQDTQPEPGRRLILEVLAS